jgi:hypothetical protein
MFYHLLGDTIDRVLLISQALGSKIRSFHLPSFDKGAFCVIQLFPLSFAPGALTPTLSDPYIHQPLIVGICDACSHAPFDLGEMRLSSAGLAPYLSSYAEESTHKSAAILS